MTHKRPYLSYLLRLWQESSDGSPIWRASLESPQTGECLGFADLASLVSFLEEQTGGISNQTSGGQGFPRPAGHG
jgi:hypothetical protein